MGLGLRSCVTVNCATLNLKEPLRAQFRSVFNIIPIWSEQAGKPRTHSEMQLWGRARQCQLSNWTNKHDKADNYASPAGVWVKCKHDLFILHWKDTLIDGKHVGYHSKQWSIFWRNPPNYSIGAGTRSRTQKSIKFVLIFLQLCGLMCESNRIYQLFFKKKKKTCRLKRAQLLQ